jgi:molybdopterin-guanine dinucleotide biosynthesis protein A
MGRDKALLDFGGVPLIVHTARLLKPLVSAVTIVGSPARYGALGLQAIADVGSLVQRGPQERSLGPLGGIATALAASQSPWNLIVACDLPYLSEDWLDWLISRALRSSGEAVIPQTDRGIEPLAAVYRRECAAAITAALVRGVRKASDAAEQLRVDFAHPREWHRIDPCELLLRNMNAPGDYEEARKWWEAGGLRGSGHFRTSLRAQKRKRRSAPRRRK